MAISRKEAAGQKSGTKERNERAERLRDTHLFDKYLLIMMQDNGTGIPEEKIPQPIIKGKS